MFYPYKGYLYIWKYVFYIEMGPKPLIKIVTTLSWQLEFLYWQNGIFIFRYIIAGPYIKSELCFHLV